MPLRRHGRVFPLGELHMQAKTRSCLPFWARETTQEPHLSAIFRDTKSSSHSLLLCFSASTSLQIYSYCCQSARTCLRHRRPERLASDLQADTGDWKRLSELTVITCDRHNGRRLGGEEFDHRPPGEGPSLK
ncbi:hypothetical protein EJ03DRAFT_144590 [Teratosphaeria nubilosa]|uniref:Uncharacterized protein n=1 Tax=Teratosphaeria nubilosa TaxID=161662 RepID=A0A6G1L509_9PEZI|nr:hypothetical protein EJ03DRAFT_144590 [Teratosphaeria nubilosa]